MSATIPLPGLAADRLQRIARLNQLLRLLRGLTGPLADPENLRSTLYLLLEIGRLVGLEPEWLERLERIVGDDRVFAIVLAIVRAVSGWTSALEAKGQLSVRSAAAGETVAAQGFFDWLPIVVEIIHLLRQLRGQAS